MRPDEVREKLLSAIEQRETTATALSRAIGRSQGYLSDFLRGKADTLAAAASAKLEQRLGLAAGSLVVDHRPEPTNDTGAFSLIKPANDREIEVFSAVEGGPGAMVVSTDPIDSVPRPYFLQGIKEAFAVMVVGESMEPKYETGDIVFVNPRYPAVRGRPAIFVGGEAQGEFRATIKLLVRQTDATWRVKQLNPTKEFDLTKKEWPKAWRVVGSKEGG